MEKIDGVSIKTIEQIIVLKRISDIASNAGKKINEEGVSKDNPDYWRIYWNNQFYKTKKPVLGFGILD
jgi:hypothetical protein